MDSTVNMRKERYTSWVTENLGEKTGVWYTPYLEKLGFLLNEYNLANGYRHNFFEYSSYSEYKRIYQEITEQSDEDIEKLVTGKGTPRYPEKFAANKINFKRKYAHEEYKNGLRSNPDNLGGIPSWGVLMRSYLIFMYYDENSALIYPKKEKKIASHEDLIDNSINYWIIAPGESSRLWDDFYNEKIIALGWEYLGPLTSYDTKDSMEKKIAEERDDGVRPINDTKAVWDFLHTMEKGDIIYVKDGIKKILASGIVTGEYYYDHSAAEYPHRRKVEWLQVGKWELHQTIAQKTLTCINRYPSLVQEIEQVMAENTLDPKIAEINEFRSWLATQVTDTGITLNDKTITSKVNAIKDIERHFNVPIFGETDIEELKQLKETVQLDATYKKYKGVSASSMDYYIRFIESKPTVEENEAFTADTFLSDVFMERKDLSRLTSLLENKKNLILKGAPGVGKTFIAKRLAYLMMEEKDESRIQMVQFHQSYSYEDFIEGFRPKAEGEGFELKQGPFVKFARKAARDPERNYFFIIDEINRGNISKIFGELMLLIESDKRGEQINLLYSNEKFSVPPNLYILGMMNSADRSLALLDYALRRRFSFYEVKPAFQNETFKTYIDSYSHPDLLLPVIRKIEKLNLQITDELGTGFQIGHSYFIGDAFKHNTLNRVEEVIEYEIIPQLHEYWFDDEEKALSWAHELRGCYHGEK